jgi:predicted transcriptional regulator
MTEKQYRDALRTAAGLTLYGVRLSISLAETGLVVMRAAQGALERVKQSPKTQKSPAKSAAAISQSVTADHVICLEDGKKFKTLKRHLRIAHDLSPQQYREKWELPADHPLVAPNYAAKRSVMAKKVDLGKRSSKAVLKAAA